MFTEEISAQVSPSSFCKDFSPISILAPTRRARGITINKWGDGFVGRSPACNSTSTVGIADLRMHFSPLQAPRGRE
jgi:hypothetical protein